MSVRARTTLGTVAAVLVTVAVLGWSHLMVWKAAHTTWSGDWQAEVWVEFDRDRIPARMPVPTQVAAALTTTTATVTVADDSTDVRLQTLVGRGQLQHDRALEETVVAADRQLADQLLAGGPTARQLAAGRTVAFDTAGLADDSPWWLQWLTSDDPAGQLIDAARPTTCTPTLEALAPTSGSTACVSVGLAELGGPDRRVRMQATADGGRLTLLQADVADLAHHPSVRWPAGAAVIHIELGVPDGPLVQLVPDTRLPPPQLQIPNL